jgi:hypothetical protein
MKTTKSTLKVSNPNKNKGMLNFNPNRETRKNKGMLNFNPNRETRKNKNMNTKCANKNPTRFYYKEEIEQGYDKKSYPKLALNSLKVMKNSISIYTHWERSSKKFLKNNSIYMWSMITHVYPCVKYE